MKDGGMIQAVSSSSQRGAGGREKGSLVGRSMMCAGLLSTEVRVQILVSLVIAGCLLLLTVQLLFPFGPEGFAINQLEFAHGDCPCSESTRSESGAAGAGNRSGATSAVKSRFQAHGSAAALFVEMSAYRGGPATFAVVGLASKPGQVFGHAGFQCAWIPASQVEGPEIAGKAWKMLPDWGFGRAYTVVVVNCTFQQDVGSDGAGGRLILTADYGQDDPRPPERFTALKEAPGEYDGSLFQASNYTYDHLYCGSPLFGPLSPRRVRQWLAYHAWLFGPRSHIVLYDAGGVHEGVRQVVEPWVKQGLVTVHDVRDQEAFDGYYHNQFLIVNDCLFRYKFLANWTYFFDLDEYLYVNPATTLNDVMRQHSNYTQVFFEQAHMGQGFCTEGARRDGASSRQPWGFEKQVYKSLKKVRRDRKYAVQARRVHSAGVHLTENKEGRSTLIKETQMRYYHYHGSITEQGDNCTDYSSVVNGRKTFFKDKEPFRYDASMSALAPAVKKFELQTIGLLAS